ncbi:hypothetical protein BDQ17DRAFT_1424006 [Cyathus striatus]|nr:hypothetical protein BDQ17DRAFT_1424006 [Cyathus striatus]
MGDLSAVMPSNGSSADGQIPDASGSSNSIPTARGYQQEMLEESLRRNIVIAIDTGSGKTLIAVLRIKHEIEREQKKVSWFFAPTVALCAQQKRVIQEYLPVSVGLISGALEPNQWKESRLWKTVLKTHRVIVSTPQVLLDALRHGYVNLGKDISLLVFDEAHHAADNHPYNKIMQEFYVILPPRSLHLTDVSVEMVRPIVLGLTASPIYGGNVEKSFRTLENNLDAVIRAPRENREELSRFVHRPVFKHIFFDLPSELDLPFSNNLHALNYVVESLNIDEDPYVISLKKQLARKVPGSADYHLLDQRLSETIAKQNTFTHRGLNDFARTANDIRDDLGAWAADWYVYKVMEKAMKAANPYNNIMTTWKESEKVYLLSILKRVVASPISYYPDDIANDCSDKVRVLIECLLEEKFETEDRNDSYSGIIFVQRRDAVLALREVLLHHPFTKGIFNVGFLLGTSDSGYRHSFLDITRKIVDDTQESTIADFKIGEKNLIVSTSVAEEGIDIQACGSVIRWDPPANMASWVQSRGRARKKRSTFTLLFPSGAAGREDVKKWERMEEEMIKLYNDPSRDLAMFIDETLEDEEEEEDLELRIESTGAVLTLHSAVSHLAHFCAVIPNTSHVDNRPIYEVDPPEYVEGWHSLENRALVPPRHPYTGPYGSRVTLPRTLPIPKREYTTECIYKSKISAHRHAAFMAYKALYENGLLNDSLLPITSMAEPHMAKELEAMLADVEKRASTAKVSLQMNPWLPDEDLSQYGDVWWCSRVSVDGLPSIRLFTRVKLEDISIEEGPFLSRPTRDPQRLTLKTLEPVRSSDDWIIDAQEYTRRLFWSLNGSRMNWDYMDFSYLFLPDKDTDFTVEQKWVDRRSWNSRLNMANGRLEEDDLFANAKLLGEEFSHPADLTMIGNGYRFAKRFQFVRWRFEQLSDEEEKTMKEEYEGRKLFLEIAYPLLEVQHLPPRTNFLLPLSPPKKTGSPQTLKHQHFLPNDCTVTLLSFADTEYAFLLPSILRCISLHTTAASLRINLFSSMPTLQSIPMQLIRLATTAPVSGESKNYQRLETLGDTVLKFTTGIQLLAEYPLWHEGYLTRKKDHAVSNVRLAKENVKRSVYRWIVRDQMLGKKWKPLYFTTTLHEDDEDEESMLGRQARKPGKEKREKQELSTKVLADVMESLIGAAFLHGSYSLGFECCRLFDLGLNWGPVPSRITEILSRVEPDPSTLPLELSYVEDMLGYKFSRKLLLIEALTHASYQGEFFTPSYERLEFLGDSVLDMLVTEYLYHAPGKEYSPGHIHLRRSAVVNGHTLAYICLKTKTVVKAEMPRFVNGKIKLQGENQDVYLWRCMMHSNPQVLRDWTNTSKRFELRQAEIEEILQKGIYPWASLTRLQASKFFSDIVESLIGAVFLDSNGNIDVARDVIKKLGIWDILEHIVRNDVDVLHPVSRLALWASKRDKELDYKFKRDRGDVSCTVLLDGEEEITESDIYYGKASQDEVKFAAAEKAIQVLKLRNVGTSYAHLKRKAKPNEKPAKSKKDKGKEKAKL